VAADRPAAQESPLIAGLVLQRDTYLSTLNKEPEPHPTLRVLEMPANIEWKLIAFHGWLQREIETKDVQPGDYGVFAYNGIKKATKAGYSDGFMYRVYVERNPAGRVVPEQALEPEPPEDWGDVPFGNDDDDPGPEVDLSADDDVNA
jgi:hypothetical protein